MEVPPLSNGDLLFVYPNRANGIFSSPDGQDVKDKMISALKLGVFCSFPGALVIQNVLGVHINSPSTFGRLIQVGVPLCGTCLLFTSAQYISAKIRGVSDTWNTAYATFATFPVFRRFLPWSYAIPFCVATCAVMITIRCLNGIGTKTLDQQAPFYCRNGINNDWYPTMQKKPAGEPAVSFKNTGFFFGKF